MTALSSSLGNKEETGKTKVLLKHIFYAEERRECTYLMFARFLSNTLRGREAQLS